MATFRLLVHLSIILILCPPVWSKGKISKREFSVGIATSDYYVPPLVSLAGSPGRRVFHDPESESAFYFKASAGIHDQPRVKAVIMSDGTHKLCWLSVDVLMIDRVLKATIQKRLSSIFGQDDRIYIFAEHTHAGPGGFAQQELWEKLVIDRFNPVVFNSIVEAAIKAVLQANAKLEPGLLYWVKGILPGSISNRRPGMPISPELNLIKLTSKSGKLLGTVLNFPVHGTLLDGQNLIISGDLPAAYEREVEAQTKAPAIFISAAAADANPAKEYKGFDGMRVLAKKMAEQTIPLLAKAQPLPFSDFKFVDLRVDLPKPSLEISVCLGTFLPKFFSGLTKHFGNFELSEEFDLPLYISRTSIGEFSFVTLPVEVTAKLGNRIREVSNIHGTSQTFVMTLADSYLGYALTTDEYLDGGYEACNSYYGAGFGDRILATVGRIARK